MNAHRAWVLQAVASAFAWSRIAAGAYCCALLVLWLAAPAAAQSNRVPIEPALPVAEGAPWSAAGLSALQRDMRAILRAATLRGAHVGLLAVQAQDGRVLFSSNADDQFMPASNLKLLIGSVALRQLGRDATFATTLWTDGTLENGVLRGNVTLRGGGDPLLREEDLRSAAAALHAQGVTRIEGALQIDASYFDAAHYPPGWSWDDLPYSYAPVISALSLEENVVHCVVRPGAAVGAPASVEISPQTAALRIDNRIVTGAPKSTDTTDIARTDANTVILTGSIPRDAPGAETLDPSVPDPRAYVSDVFLRALAQQGIVVAGDPQPAGTPRQLWSHASEPLSALIAQLWYTSDNLIAEVLLKAVGAAATGAPGSTQSGIEVERRYLRSLGLASDAASLSDGSGLSIYNRISPRALVRILKGDWDGPEHALVLDALPVAGVRGTLQSSFVGTPAENNVFAKTGSVSHVRAISGYLRTRHGAVIFSFLIDDWIENIPALAKLRAALFARFIAG